MIKRIVAMELQSGQEGPFLDIFDRAKNQIRSMQGCHGLEVLQSVENQQVSIWTISLWENEEALEHYRASDLFKQTWSAVKPMFSSKARAWTLTPIEQLA